MRAAVTTDMWCYQNPEFGALLVTELQRQQQYSKFCDTLLEAEGVFVPVHSWVLSAFSPCISSALASASPPPAGQKHLLRFQTLRACTLLHIIRLLYSGEMEGEGDKEKQETISAAAKLGIRGLVEVTKRPWRCRHGEGEGAGPCVEVGVQTEPEERTGNRSRWRREVRDGDVCLWKETVSEGGQDVGTQTEALQIAPPPPQPAPSYQTIDIDVFQSLGQTNVPVSIVYPPDANKTAQQLVSLQESTADESSCVVAAQHTSFPPSLPHSNQMTPRGAEPQDGWSTSQAAAAAAAEDEEGECFEQFEGNIPGFISYFFDPDKGDGPGRKCAGRRPRRGRPGGAQRRGTGARRPRGARRGGRGRGTLTQTVDVQEVVVVGRLQKLFLHRSGGRAGRMGQGGGAAGRRLQTKTRELLNADPGLQRRRVRNKVWEVNQTGDLRLCRKVGRGGNGQRGRKDSTPQQGNMDALPGSHPQWSSAKSSSSASFVLSPAAGSALLCSPSAGLRPPAAPYMYPAASFLHTCPLPLPACPPQDDQPEHIDRLLEEVMMGLDILPNSTSTPAPAQSGGCAAGSSGDASTQTRQPCRSAGLLKSPDVVAVVREAAGSCPAGGAVPVLQQEAEGEMNKMLDQFLQSFERHVERSRVEKDAGAEGRTEAGRSAAGSPRPQNTGASQHVGPPEAAGEQSGQAPWGRSSSPERVGHLPAGHPVRRKQEPSMLSVEKKQSCDVNVRLIDRKGENQLQQIPVVKLRRSLQLPTGVTLQDSSCQSVEQKVRSETAAPAAVNFGKKQWSFCERKTYPTRSRFKRMSLSNNVPIIEEPVKKHRVPSAGPGRPRINKLHVKSSSSSSDQHQEESSVQPQVKATQPMKRGRKKKRICNEKPGDDVTAAKRVCTDQSAQQVCETATATSESAGFVSEPAAVEPEEVIDVETVSLAGGGDEAREEKPTPIEIALNGTEDGLMDEQSADSSNELIDVEIEDEDEDEGRSGTTPPRPARKFGPESPGSSNEERDEDVDVIGGSSPSPEPVVISWTDSSEAEQEEEEEGDEDVDVVKETAEWASPALFGALQRSE